MQTPCEQTFGFAKIASHQIFRSERNSNPEKTPNADPMSQSGDLDRNIQPINEPQRESMVVQQPAGDEFKPSRAPICVTPPLGSAQVDSREEPSITDPDSVGSHLFALNNKVCIPQDVNGLFPQITRAVPDR